METIDVKAVATIAPAVSEKDLTFTWNHAELKKYLVEKTDQYKGLIVDDNNLDSMKKTLKEVVTMRTTLNKFGTEQKRILKAPADTFAMELNDVLSVIAKVENPLQEQIKSYEELERQKRSDAVEREISLKAEAAGIREEYLQFIQRDDKWLNKTAKLSNVVIAIDEQIAIVKEQQQTADDLAKLKAEKVELFNYELAQYNTNYGLSTPVIEREITRFYDMSITEGKEAIKALFEHRMEIEAAAMKPVTPVATPTVATEKPKEPANYKSRQETCLHDVKISIPTITDSDLYELVTYLRDCNLEYGCTVGGEEYECI